MSHVTFGSFFNFLYIYGITVHYMTYDLIVIGAGPAGLTAGIYARTKMMSTLVLDAGVVGGQLVSLYPEKGIHNYPGYETIQARKLSDKLYAQAESLGCEIREKEKVMDVDDGNEELIVRTDKAEYHTKSIIVAIGMGMFKPRRMGCDGELELEGKGLSYILPLKEEIVGKKVVVFGGGNSAIEIDRKSTRLNSSHSLTRISYAVFSTMKPQTKIDYIWSKPAAGVELLSTSEIGRASCRERV